MALTDRQLEILTLKAEGKTVREIVTLLHLSKTTVNTELSAVCAHYGVGKPAAAISAARAQGIIPGPQVNQPFSLTARETRVGRLVAAGKTNKEITDELHMSQKVVKTCISSMLRKLGCTNRAALAAALTSQDI